MIVSLIILGALLGVGALCYAHHKLTGGDKPDSTPSADSEQSDSCDDTEPDVCCGQHVVCSKTSLLADATAEPEYFDDEELDAFCGRDALSYSAEETEMFRDVLLTLIPDEIPAWARSIQQRGIALPPDVRDELILLVAEQRTSSTRSNNNTAK